MGVAGRRVVGRRRGERGILGLPETFECFRNCRKGNLIAKRWAMYCSHWLSFIASAVMASPALAQEYNLNTIEGKWVSVTPGPDLGEPVWFRKAFEGYDVNVPFFQGQSSLSRSSEYGSHVKIVSRNNEYCFYYVGIINGKEMTWNLRYATSPNCPRSALFRRDP